MTEIMKERRIELGKELEEAAEITRIKSSYLKAIEEEDFAKLPIAVYTKGYIREYAKFLGVDAEAIIDSYDRYLAEKKGIKGKGAPAKEKTTVSESINEQAVSPVPAESPKNTKKALLVLPLIAIVIAAYFLLGHQGEKAPEIQPKQPVPAIQEPQPVPSQQDTQPSPQIPVPVPTEKGVDKKDADKTKTEKAEPKKETKPKDETAASPKKKNNLDIKATDKVWLQIIIDGSEKKELTLNAGDRIVYGADKSFSIIVGNAAGVILKYNNKAFDTLGEKGQVVRLNLPEMKSPQIIQNKNKNSEGVSPEAPKSDTSDQNQ